MANKKVQKNKKVKVSSRKKTAGYGFLFGILIVAVFIAYLGFNNINNDTINNYEECVMAGNPVMDSYPSQCEYEGKVFVASVETRPLSIMQIDKSENGRNLQFERGNYIINSNEEWENIFGEIDVDPNVDFETKTVIAVVMGQKSSGGYSVNLKQLEVTSDAVQFMVEERMPGENCMVTEALTNPYQIIAIDKTEKEIKFMGNTITVDCE